MGPWMEPFAGDPRGKEVRRFEHAGSGSTERGLVQGRSGQGRPAAQAGTGQGTVRGRHQAPTGVGGLGLIDEYEFVVHPRIVGHGPTVFADLSKPIDLKLVSRLELGSGWWRCGMSR